MSLDYLDFDLEISEGSDGGDYAVAVVHSPAGEIRATMRFPYGDLELENRLQSLQIALLRSGGQRRRALSKEEQAVQDFGRDLFDALLTSDVRALYYESQREAAHKGQGLRLKLRIQPPELATLPWEFLHDARNAEYVCLSRNTPVVRYLELRQPIRPLRVTPPLRILGMIANPQDPNLDPLNVDVEKQRVERAVQDLVDDSLVELHWLPGQTWRDLQRAMRRGPWHVFHFVGHGGFDEDRGEGLVVFANRTGNAHFLGATELASLLADHNPLRLALLNSCEGARGGTTDIFSSTAATLVRRGIPAALAMQYEITDSAAIEFAQTFYESLTDRLPVDAAVSEARKAIRIGVKNSFEWGTPVLFMRGDGVVFEIGQSEVQSPASKVQGVERWDTREVDAPGTRETTPAQVTKPQPPRSPIDFDWVQISAGEFLMGSDKAQDEEAYDDELPQHTLPLATYWIARTPVTVAQFAQFVNATSHKTTAEEQGSSFGWTGSKWEEIKGAHWQKPHGPKSDVAQKADHPVTAISWHDALAFCQWAGVQLPSEAEWEKAARGTDGRIYPWGNEAPDETRCNFNMHVKDTTPVGHYPTGNTPTGLQDMAGNVWEWTRSLWGTEIDKPDFGYPYKADDGREQLDAADSVARVVRGGSWNYDPDLVRAAVRFRDSPHNRFDRVGVRVVWSPGF